MRTDRILTRAEFAAELTRLRESAGMSVRDVARRSGIAASTAGGYFSGRHLPPVTVPETLTSLLAALGVTDEHEHTAWAEALRRVRKAPGPRRVGQAGPYRGLAGFEPEDAEWFFGREDLLVRLRETVDAAHGPVLVIGASGAGKSSVLRAGFVADLRAEGRTVALLTPHEHPMAALAAALDVDPAAGPAASGQMPVVVVDQLEELFTLCSDDGEREEFLDRLATHPAAVVLGMRADFYPHALAHPVLREAMQHHQVLVGPMDVEQVRRAVLGPAARAGVEVEPALLDVLLHEFAYEPGALPLLSHALLATWQRAGGAGPTLEHYRAVGGIARAIAVTADQVFDTLTPAEQETARRMFLRMVTVPDDVTVTRRRVPLAELADLAETTQVRERFLAARLITTDRDTVELAHEALAGAWPRLTGWIDADRAGLRLHRALTESSRAWQEAARDETMLYRGGRLELSAGLLGDGHSSQLTRLERDFLVASIAQQRAEQQRDRRRTSRLRRLAIVVALSLVATSSLAWYAFHLRDAATTARDEARSRQLALEAGRVADSDTALATQLSLAAYRISPTRQAFSQLISTSSVPRSTRLVGRDGSMQGLATHRRPDGRMLVAGVGEAGSGQLWRLTDGHLTGSAPLTADGAKDGPGQTSFTADFSPDGRTLAVAGAGGTVRLWTVPDAGRPTAGRSLRLPDLPRPFGGAATVYALAYSPDGSILAIGDSGGRVMLWRPARDTAPTVLKPAARPGHPTGPSAGEAHALAWAPDGSQLLAGLAMSADEQAPASGAVVRWSIDRGTGEAGTPRLMPGRFDEVLGLAVGPGGRQVAAGTRGGDVVRWRQDSAGKATSEPALTGPGSWVNGVAFSPDGRTLAAASSDSRVWLWDLGAAARKSAQTSVDQKPVPLDQLQHPSPVTAVRFLDDGRLASAGTDGVARVWDTPPPSPAGLSRSVFGIQYAAARSARAKGRRLLAAGGNNELRLWDTSDPRRPYPLGGMLSDPDPARRLTGALALSPDGGLLAVGNDNGDVRLWDTSDPARPVALPSLSGSTLIVEWLALSRDARMLAQVGDDGMIRLWNLADPVHPEPLGTAKMPGIVFGASFSPDGRTLAAAGMDGAVQLWDLSDPAHPAAAGAPLTGLSTTVISVMFSPDGRTLAAAGYNRSVQLWDVRDVVHPRRLGAPLTGPTNVVYGLAFSPDGNRLAAASNDGAVWWWELADPAHPVLQAALTGRASSLNVVGFAEDGRTLSAGGADGRVESWQTDVAEVIGSICGSAGTPLTAAEWSQYAPGTDYTRPCP